MTESTQAALLAGAAELLGSRIARHHLLDTFAERALAEGVGC